MSFYEANLVVLVLVNTALFYGQRRRTWSSAPTAPPDYQEKDDVPGELEADEHRHIAAAANSTGSEGFVKQYFVGHLLAFAGDWLQVRAPARDVPDSER
jgi:hypothetical protein